MLELIQIIELHSRLSCGILAVIFRLILALLSLKSRLTKIDYDNLIILNSLNHSILFPRAPPRNNSPLNERGEHKRGSPVPISWEEKRRGAIQLNINGVSFSKTVVKDEPRRDVACYVSTLKISPLSERGEHKRGSHQNISGVITNS